MSTNVTFHIQPGDPPPTTHLLRSTLGPLASVRLDDGHLAISGDSPAALLAVAQAFTDAATQLAARLDRVVVPA